MAQGTNAGTTPSLLRVRAGYRSALWMGLLVLTGLLLLYPIKIRVEYQLHEIPWQVFAPLPLFVALYYLWLCDLLLLLFSTSTGSVNYWEKAAIVALFGLVFWGTWPLVMLYGSDEEFGFLRYVAYIDEHGRIPTSNALLSYGDFPGLHLFGFSLHQVTGLDLFPTRTVLLLFNSLYVPLILFLTYRVWLHRGFSPLLLAVPLMIQSNHFLSGSFFWRPEAGLGFALVLTAFFMLLRTESAIPGAFSARVVTLLLFFGLVITHFVSSVVFVMALVALPIFERITRVRLASFPFLRLALAGLASWQVYWTAFVFPEIFPRVFDIAQYFREGRVWYYLLNLGASNLGGEVSLWVRLVRSFWLLSVFVGGGLIMLVSLLQLRRLPIKERQFVAAFSGVVAASLLGMAADLAGNQVIRVVEYGGVFLAPILLATLAPLLLRRVPLYLLLLGVFVALSFPTFIAHNSRNPLGTHFRYDISWNDFLKAASPSPPANMSIFSSAREWAQLNNESLRDATLSGAPIIAPSWTDPEAWWAYAEGIVLDFDGTRKQLVPGESAFFVYSPSFIFGASIGAPFTPTDPRWAEVLRPLTQANQVYDSQYVQVYQ